jgi:hypothetical protein
MEATKTTYEALNSQLIEDLPKLLEISTAIYTRCIAEFVLLRKLFAGRITRELLDLMTVSGIDELAAASFSYGSGARDKYQRVSLFSIFLLRYTEGGYVNMHESTCI